MAHEFPLPFDLIPTILDHLPSESYFGLLRVCKAFYQHVVPRVYRSITFEARPSRRHARRLALLLRSLLERPGLAACVRSFRLQGDLVVWARTRPWPCNDAPKSSSHQLWGLEGSTVLSRTQLQLASNHFYQLLDDDWHHGLQLHGRAMDALAILVLARFTDLATLELGDGFRTYSLLLPQVLQRASTLFPKLAHVVLGDKQLPRQKSTRPDGAPHFCYLDLDLIRPLFHLPRVQTIEFSMTQPWQFAWGSRPSSPPRTESLTKLHLFRSSLTAATLNQLLAVTPYLRSLRYEHDIPLLPSRHSSRTKTWSSVDLTSLGRALGRVRYTLEECVLTLRATYPPAAPASVAASASLCPQQPPPVQGSLAALHGMDRLARVELPLIVLLGWCADAVPLRLDEILPHSLHSLCLRDDLFSFCSWVTGPKCSAKFRTLGSFLEGRNAHTPHLQHFSVKVQDADQTGWLPDAMRAMNSVLHPSTTAYDMLERAKRAPKLEHASFLAAQRSVA